MKPFVLAFLVACSTPAAAEMPDATPADAAADAAVPWTDAFKIVPCGADWTGVMDGPDRGVPCMAGCADHSLIGLDAHVCQKARIVNPDGSTFDGFSCTAATATRWNGWDGCCMIRPDFAYVPTNPPYFAVCDDQPGVP